MSTIKSKGGNLSEELKIGSSITSLAEREALAAALVALPGKPSSRMMALEPRILLDAAGVETATEVADQVAVDGPPSSIAFDRAGSTLLTTDYDRDLIRIWRIEG